MTWYLFGKIDQKLLILMIKKNAPGNIPSRGVSCTVCKTKIEEANLLNSQNNLEKAFEIYKDILREKPEHSAALFGVGVILQKQKEI